MKAITTILVLMISTATYADDPAKTTDKPKTTDTTKPAKLTATELQVMAHYNAVDQLEIDLGKTAQKQAGTQAVKSYGQMLVTDHTEHAKQLKAIAKQTKQMIPAEKATTDTEKQEQADMKKNIAALKKLKGTDFDREYLRMMVEGHDKELANIDTRIGDVQNQQLADLLRATKPTLQKHADQARELQKSGAQASVSHDHK